jgi:hypothetical protein
MRHHYLRWQLNEEVATVAALLVGPDARAAAALVSHF